MVEDAPIEAKARSCVPACVSAALWMLCGWGSTVATAEPAGWQGTYAGISYSQDADGDSFVVSLVGLAYPKPWLALRHGLGWLESRDLDVGYLTVGYGLRLHIPERFSPFVGAGLLLGYHGHIRPADREYLVALHPEAGVHIWITPRIRLTAHMAVYQALWKDLDGVTMYGAEAVVSF